MSIDIDKIYSWTKTAKSKLLAYVVMSWNNDNYTKISYTYKKHLWEFGKNLNFYEI